MLSREGSADDDGDEEEDGYMLSTSLQRASQEFDLRRTPSEQPRRSAGAPSTHPYVCGAPGRRKPAGAESRKPVPVPSPVPASPAPTNLGHPQPAPPPTRVPLLNDAPNQLEKALPQGSSTTVLLDGFSSNSLPADTGEEVLIMCTAILKTLKQFESRFQETNKLIMNSSNLVEQTLGRHDKNLERTLGKHQDQMKDRVVRGLSEVLRQQTEDIRVHFQSEFQLAMLAEERQASKEKAQQGEASPPALGVLLAAEGDHFHGLDTLMEMPNGYGHAGMPGPFPSPPGRNKAVLTIAHGDSGMLPSPSVSGMMPSPTVSKRPSNASRSIRGAETPRVGSPLVSSKQLALGSSKRNTNGSDFYLNGLEKASMETAATSGNGNGNGHNGIHKLDALDASVKSHDVLKLVEQISPAASRRKRGAWRARMSFFRAEEPERSGCLFRTVHSLAFERLVGAVIVLNAMFIGGSLQWSIEHPMDDLPLSYRVLEMCFLSFYGLELLLKLMIHRFYFFINEEWKWNLFDFTLVILTGEDLLFTHLLDGAGFNLTFLRILRIMRVSKLFRIFRVVPFFNELRVMLLCILGSLRSLLWSILVLSLFYYIFAVLFMNGVATWLRTGPDEADAAAVRDWYGSIFISMESLFMASTSGVDWREIGKPLQKVGNIYYGLFLFYIAFVLFAFLNILTGIFVDGAIRASKGDMEGSILSRLEEERHLEAVLSGLFSVMDTNHDGYLTFEEFNDHLQEGVHWAYFTSLGLDIKDSSEFYQLLCQYSRMEYPDERAFVRACRRFRGDAKFSDICHLRVQSADMRARMAHMQRSLEHLRELQQQEDATSQAMV